MRPAVHNVPSLFRSAVLKLTAAYTAIIVGLSLIFSFVLYKLTVHELNLGFSNEYHRWYLAFEPFGLRSPAAPTQELATRSHHIFLQLVYLNILVLLLALVACYILARRSLRPIEAAHEQQKRFTADVSHELRTPLTAMRMESEVSLADPKSRIADLRDALRSNLEEVDRMEALINNLLMISQMEADKLRVEFGRLNNRELVESAIASTARAADVKKIKVTLTARDAFVRGDRTSLTQLYVILIENAIKYSPAGSEIKITLRRGRSRSHVNIVDAGPGIPATDLAHVFDRFYRADTSRVRDASDSSPQGFGLGLSIAKLIADLHDGEIVITSTPGKGTTVGVGLPNSAR